MKGHFSMVAFHLKATEQFPGFGGVRSGVLRIKLDRANMVKVGPILYGVCIVC